MKFIDDPEKELDSIYVIEFRNSIQHPDTIGNPERTHVIAILIPDYRPNYISFDTIMSNVGYYKPGQKLYIRNDKNVYSIDLTITKLKE